VRVITATNRNLKQLVEAGSFRGDFYYRINVLPIVLPPDIVQGREQPLPNPSADVSLDGRKKRELIQALDQANGNQSLAGRILGISRVTVWNRMHRYGIR